MTIAEIHRLFLQSKAINRNSQTLVPGEMFIGIKGENFDGNQFAAQAIQSGATYAIIDNPKYLINHKTILVKDSVQTLQHLAAFHRRYIDIPIIALTGSNGKTTTKELINAVLSQKFITVATQGNLNNHIGVPITLLSMDKNTQIGIVEMGANHPGEIDFLCNIAQPDYGYITNFGRAHLEGFGNLQGVIKAKTELYRYLIQNEKEIFVNTLDLEQVKRTEKAKKITFGTDSSNNTLVEKLETDNPYIGVKYNELSIQSHLVGNYNFTNIAAAIAIGEYFKVNPADIKNAIENYIPKNNRSQIITKNSNTILLDAYNANPTSMEAAIESFSSLNAKKKILFLGDMFELGPSAAEEHQNIVDMLTRKNFQAVYLLGNNFSKTISQHPNIKKFKSFDDLKDVDFSKINSAHILIKGSRGMKMERILDYM